MIALTRFMPKPTALLLAALLLAALLGAVVPNAPASAQAPGPADPAAAAVERCRADDLVRERRCYEEALLAALREAGPRATLALLGRLAALDADVRREGHMYAHGIGISALRAPAEVGQVFAECTADFQSGCYHGVIQSYFLALQRGGGEIATATVDAVCGDYREPAGNAFLLFQCTHGLGHGLTMFYGHDLPQALVACDLMSRPAERENCYGGAFMENVVNATHPHHGVAEAPGHEPAAGHGAAAGEAAQGGHGGHGGHGDHGGHGGGGAPAAAAAPFRALDPDDLHYPCSIVAAQYVVACYTIQTAAILHHTGHDMRRTAEECARAPERARITCFVSLGRDISGIAAADPARAAGLCDLAAEAFRPACHIGVVQSLVNIDADPATGLPYCRLVAEPESKRACYRAAGDQASVHPDAAARRRHGCRDAEAAYRDDCLGVLAPAPPAAADPDR